MAVLPRAAGYTSETHAATLRGRTITVENRSPRLTEQERDALLLDIGRELYDLFSQYEDGSSGAAGV